MSERMTSIHLPTLRNGAGLAEYGRVEPEKMIAIIRRYAERQKNEAEAILAAKDEHFQVATYVGVHVQRKYEIIQPSSLEGGAS